MLGLVFVGEIPRANRGRHAGSAGSWVIFKLPGIAKAAEGAEQSSLDALRTASKTSWFKDSDALWVKLVSTGYKHGSNPGAADSLQVRMNTPVTKVPG